MDQNQLEQIGNYVKNSHRPMDKGAENLTFPGKGDKNSSGSDGANRDDRTTAEISE